MIQYRFSIPASMCFTIFAETLEKAEEQAREFSSGFDHGVDVGPNFGEFSDTDARMYTDSGNEPPEVCDIEDDDVEQEEIE